jgi:hypothetical protein
MNVIIYALLGKLIIYLVQKFPFQSLPIIGKLWEEKRFFGKLFGCDLCLGWYVFVFLAYFFNINLFLELGLPYVPVLNEILVGSVTTFLVHLISIGWKSKFELIILE